MPKIRPLNNSFYDMLKHARVASARLETLDNIKLQQDLARKITAITSELQSILQLLPSNDEEVGSYSNEELYAASNLINKEAKKNVARMKPIEILRAMHNCINQIDAIKIGLAQGITQEQIKILIKKAPPDTPLGKIIAAKELLRAKQNVVSAVIQPVVMEDEGITNDSDITDDDMKRMLAVGD